MQYSVEIKIATEGETMIISGNKLSTEGNQSFRFEFNKGDMNKIPTDKKYMLLEILKSSRDFLSISEELYSLIELYRSVDN